MYDLEVIAQNLFAFVLQSPNPIPTDADDTLRDYLTSQAEHLSDEELLVVLPLAVEKASTYLHAHDGTSGLLSAVDRLHRIGVLTRLMAFGGTVLIEVMDKVAAG